MDALCVDVIMHLLCIEKEARTAAYLDGSANALPLRRPDHTACRKKKTVSIYGRTLALMVCRLNASTEEKAAIRERNIAEREGSP